MMHEAVVLPDLGVADPMLSLWFVQVGEPVEMGDRLVEILAAGATVEVTAPCSGRLVEKCVSPEHTLTTGQVLGYIDITNTATEQHR